MVRPAEVVCNRRRHRRVRDEDQWQRNDDGGAPRKCHQHFLTEQRACGHVDNQRQPAVVAHEPRLAAERDEAVDLGDVRIGGHPRAGHRSEFAQHDAVVASAIDRLVFELAAEELAVAGIGRLPQQ